MPIFISSTPTVEKDDLKIARELLKQEVVSDIDVVLPGFKGKQHFYTNMGRSALYLILKALGIGRDQEVIIQSFTCVALIQPLLWLDIRPVYVDIDLNSYNMSLESVKRRLTEKTRAVIIQHTFGIPAPIEEIREYIDGLNESRESNKKIYLIEDCAHCLNIKKGDSYLGTFGDVSFFSFGQDKVVSTTQGGCAIANNLDIENRLKELYKEIPNMPDSMIRYNLRYPLLWNSIKKSYFTPAFLSKSKHFSKFTIGKFLILLFRLFGLTKHQAGINSLGDPKEDVYRLSNKQKHLLKNQINKADRLREHRATTVNSYSKLLNSNINGSLLRYPLLVDTPAVLKSKLQKIEVISGNWYNYPVIPKGLSLKRIKYHLGSCPNTEYAMEHIVNLPTGIDVDKESVKRIVDTVKGHML